MPHSDIPDKIALAEQIGALKRLWDCNGGLRETFLRHKSSAVLNDGDSEVISNHERYNNMNIAEELGTAIEDIMPIFLEDSEANLNSIINDYRATKSDLGRLLTLVQVMGKATRDDMNNENTKEAIKLGLKEDYYQLTLAHEYLEKIAGAAAVDITQEILDNRILVPKRGNAYRVR